MKKNFYYFSLLLGLVFGMTMFTACGGDDGDGGGAPDGGETGFVPGKFMGPKRVFGDNLLSSFGTENTRYELTYNSENFVIKMREVGLSSSSTKDYEVTYADKQITINRTRSDSERVRQYVFTIGNNGFVESCTEGYLDSSNRDVFHYEYDSDGHVTKVTVEDDKPYGGIFTWQNGNIIAQTGIGDHEDSSCSYIYNDISNVVGLQLHAYIGSSDDYFEPVFYYMGLFGKSTANLVKSYSYSRGYNSGTGENAWTLDDAGRPIKCVRTSTSTSGDYSSTTTSTYTWSYK